MGLEQLTKFVLYAILSLTFGALETHPLACCEREAAPVDRAWRGAAVATAGPAMACPSHLGAYALYCHVF